MTKTKFETIDTQTLANVSGGETKSPPWEWGHWSRQGPEDNQYRIPKPAVRFVQY